MACNTVGSAFDGPGPNNRRLGVQIGSSRKRWDALRLLCEEGLENAWDRHRTNSEKMWLGLEELGLELHVPHCLRLPTLTTVRIPAGIDGKAFSAHLLNKHGVEIGNGLGSLAGEVWRIGLMGTNSTPANVELLLNLLELELPIFRTGRVAA